MAETTSEHGAQSLGEVVDSVRGLSASPLLYVGAIAVGLAPEVAELAGLTGLLEVVAVFGTALALLWGQLAVLAYLGWADASACRGC